MSISTGVKRRVTRRTVKSKLPCEGVRGPSKCHRRRRVAGPPRRDGSPTTRIAPLPTPLRQRCRTYRGMRTALFVVITWKALTFGLRCLVRNGGTVVPPRYYKT